MSACLCGDPECPLCGESPAYAARMAQWAAEEEAQLREQGRCLSCREPITEPAPSEDYGLLCAECFRTIDHAIHRAGEPKDR